MDRRIAGRENLSEPIEFELGLLETGEARALMSVAQGLDINSHGMGLLAQCPLAKGMVMRLSIPANGFGTTLPVFAEVSWTIPVSDRFRAGLRFL